MASSLVGVMVSTSGDHPWSFLESTSALSFSNNGRTNDSVFPVQAPIIREQKPALQVKLIQANQNIQLEECTVALFPGFLHT